MCTRTGYQNHTLKVSRLYTKFEFPVARQNLSLLATAHDRETGYRLTSGRLSGSGWKRSKPIVLEKVKIVHRGSNNNKL